MDPKLKKWKLIRRESQTSATSDATEASVLIGLCLYKLQTCTFTPLIYIDVQVPLIAQNREKTLDKLCTTNNKNLKICIFVNN
jgi:hypothetical protein